MNNRTINSKFRKAQKVKYRQEHEIVNNHHSCTSLQCDYFQTDKDGEVDITRQKRDIVIQYRHEKKDDIKRIHPQTSSKTRIWHSTPALRYVTAKFTLQIFIHSDTTTTCE